MILLEMYNEREEERKRDKEREKNVLVERQRCVEVPALL
jgi:hypothetical protein